MKTDLFNSIVLHLAKEKNLEKNLFEMIFKPLNVELDNVNRKLDGISNYDKSLRMVFFDMFIKSFLTHNFENINEIKEYLERIKNDFTNIQKHEVEQNGKRR